MQRVRHGGLLILTPVYYDGNHRLLEKNGREGEGEAKNFNQRTSERAGDTTMKGVAKTLPQKGEEQAIESETVGKSPKARQ